MNDLLNLKIENKKQFYYFLEEYLTINISNFFPYGNIIWKNNKISKISCKKFIEFSLNYYNKHNLKKIFNIDIIYLKNTYYKKKICLLSIEQIYEFSKIIKNNQNFCSNFNKAINIKW